LETISTISNGFKEDTSLIASASETARNSKLLFALVTYEISTIEKFRGIRMKPDIPIMVKLSNGLIKSVGIPTVLLALLFSISGCTGSPSLENGSETNLTPSPSAQVAPSPSPSLSPNQPSEESNSENSKAEDNMSEPSIYPDETILKTQEFQAIITSLEETTNAGRFEEINSLLGVGFIDKETADAIYQNVEDGKYETLAYQMYLHQKSLEKE
jgi:hypothetical protein